MAKQYADQVAEGMDVYDVNDEKIGTVSEVYDATVSGGGPSRSGGGYLRVPTGFLGLGREHHIPFSAIRDVEDDRIRLGIRKEELDTLGYGESPSVIDEGAASTTTSAAAARDVAADESARRAGTDQERRRLRLREEELIPRKRSVQAGEVRLETEVVSEQRTVEVPVTREEVYVERHAVERRPAERPISETGETIQVPVHEEEVTVEKRPVVYEEVDVGKRQVQETQEVSGTVRREQLRVDREGDVPVGGAGTAAASGGWDAARAGYRTRWQQRYGSGGGRWEDVEPAYRYGYELRDRSEYRGKGWTDIESDARRDWERQHPNTPWDRAREGIREAWESTTNR
jgi:uncharacterized protein (TIGR02271 family)